MSDKLFQSFAGRVRQHALVNGSSVPAETPFLALGLAGGKDGADPKLLVMLQGGTIATVNLNDAIIEMTDEMKRALADVVLKS